MRILKFMFNFYLQENCPTTDSNCIPSFQITNMLRDWTASYRNEATKSLRGLGKYRLAPGFQQFFVDPVRWYQWSTERRRQHCDAFFHHKPKIGETFARPSNAGLKGNGTQKRRRDESEADLFVDRFSNMPAKKATPPSQPPQNERNRKITPIKLLRTGESTYAAQRKPNEKNQPEPATAFDPLDPHRAEKTLYHLVHKDDKKNFPRQVSRCEQCRHPFSNADVVFVRSTGIREYTCKKTGQQKKQSGNIYFHFLDDCLKKYCNRFSFSAVLVLKETMKRLPQGSLEKFKKLGLQIEP